MSHLEPTAIPYGVYYCRTCAGPQPCDPAVGESAMDPTCALECLTCGARIGEETDTVERYPLPPVVTTRQTLTPEQREAGRALARSMALGSWDREYPRVVPAPVAPPPGYRERAAADIDRLRGRR